MLRFLYFLLIVFLARLAWSAVSAWLGEQTRRQMNSRGGEPSARTIHKGLMVRDPVCGLHLPENRAIVGTRGAERHYFCSERCRETFLRASS